MRSLIQCLEETSFCIDHCNYKPVYCVLYVVFIMVPKYNKPLFIPKFSGASQLQQNRFVGIFMCLRSIMLLLPGVIYELTVCRKHFLIYFSCFLYSITMATKTICIALIHQIITFHYLTTSILVIQHYEHLHLLRSHFHPNIPVLLYCMQQAKLVYPIYHVCT